MHTTNYFNTFIEVAEDCPTSNAEIPPQKGDAKTLATLQFEKIYDHPYAFTSDDIVFYVHSIKNNIRKEDLEEERGKFFSKGQPCLRSSPLAKRYGWGMHHNEEGKVALFPKESEEYEKFSKDPLLKHTKGMRSKRV